MTSFNPHYNSMSGVLTHEETDTERVSNLPRVQGHTALSSEELLSSVQYLLSATTGCALGQPWG